MIPDSPYEPDLEIVAKTEPKIIPLDEKNRIGGFKDFSYYKPPEPSVLPYDLASLNKRNLKRSSLQSNLKTFQLQMGVESNRPKQPLLSLDILNQPGISLPVTSSYDSVSCSRNAHTVPCPHFVAGSCRFAEPITSLSSNSLLGMSLYDQLNMPPPLWNPQEMFPPDQYYGRNYSANPNMMPGMQMRPPVMNIYRPNMPRDPPPRIMGPFPRNAHTVLCRHLFSGSCRFGLKCSFLHPGINGPPL